MNNIEIYIEHLQELGKVIITDENVDELQKKLSEKGYITKFESTDSDCLVLVERYFGINVNGAWYLDSLPTMLVIEKDDSELKMFYLNPFKFVKESDLKEYKGYHPRKCKGQPLPGYLYKFYGLEKSDETASEVIHVRLTPSEKSKADDFAKNKNKTISEVIRDYIKLL